MADARQEYGSARATEQRRAEAEREERLASLAGQAHTPRSPSDFQHRSIGELRRMIESANPAAIDASGLHWRSAADGIGGEDGRGGIRKSFADAVEHASAHWEGSAAQAFRREAAKVLAKIDRTYAHARVVERSLVGTRGTGPEHGVAHNLREAKQAMAKIHDPGTAGSELEAGDDSQFRRDMANPKMDTRTALELNRGSLPMSKQRQVEAVVVMDELAANYHGHAKVLRESHDPRGVAGDWPKHPSSSPAPAPVNVSVAGGSAVHQPARQAPGGAGGGAVPAGFDGPKVSRPEVPTTTGLASVQGGTLAPPHGGTGAVAAVGPVGTGTPGAGHGAVAGPVGGLPAGAIPPGVLGIAGAGTGSGTPRAAGGGVRTPGARAAGRPGGAAGGTAGAGPVPAGGGAKGRAGAPGSAAGRGGAPARARGGAAGTPGGPAGGTRQGGSALHRSRGGAKAAEAGAPGKGKAEKERTGGQRPDHLIEDEEPRAPERTVAPRVIE
ncbi:hypothetical protein [Streptomyces sp. GS7]|uniref:hypothetical protein n=1 Tax=Streptomyces sp. GS7 TaxID=2692234 RepID=UPI00131655BC|nr:hypothetical protein [Streptomyces sp. GS7]QHC25810.1 hypothetical protein GR130_34925 [Streptomyces sp. GS7]